MSGKDRGNVWKGLKECSARSRFGEGSSVFVLGNGSGCVGDCEIALKSGSCCVF